MQHLLELKDLLQEIIRGDLGNIDKDLGLCHAIDSRGLGDALLTGHKKQELLKGWIMFSGYTDYPISHPNYSGAWGAKEYYEQNLKDQGLWKGEQLRRRQSLCVHILKEVDSRLCKLILTYKTCNTVKLVDTASIILNNLTNINP